MQDCTHYMCWTGMMVVWVSVGSPPLKEKPTDDCAYNNRQQWRSCCTPTFTATDRGSQVRMWCQRVNRPPSGMLLRSMMPPTGVNDPLRVTHLLPSSSPQICIRHASFNPRTLAHHHRKYRWHPMEWWGVRVLSLARKMRVSLFDIKSSLSCLLIYIVALTSSLT